MTVPVVEVGTQLSTASADSTRSPLREWQLGANLCDRMTG